MTIYIFGNQDISIDSLPVKLNPNLKREFPYVTFKHVDPTENWWNGEQDITVIDTVANLSDVQLFDSLDNFTATTKRLSPHDYDVYMDLKLMMKIGKIKKVTIIGISPNIAARLVLAQVVPLIKRLI